VLVSNRLYAQKRNHFSVLLITPIPSGTKFTPASIFNMGSLANKLSFLENVCMCINNYLLKNTAHARTPLGTTLNALEINGHKIS